eukprot:4512585-Amphidinium_carterae.1
MFKLLREERKAYTTNGHGHPQRLKVDGIYTKLEKSCEIPCYRMQLFPTTTLQKNVPDPPPNRSNARHSDLQSSLRLCFCCILVRFLAQNVGSFLSFLVPRCFCVS